MVKNFENLTKSFGHSDSRGFAFDRQKRPEFLAFFSQKTVEFREIQPNFESLTRTHGLTKNPIIDITVAEPALWVAIKKLVQRHLVSLHPVADNNEEEHVERM